MAVISDLDLADLRRKYARKMGNSGETKPPLNASFQAIETWMVSGATVTPTTSLFAAIDAATTPLIVNGKDHSFTFSNLAKKAQVAFWCVWKFRKDG